MCAGIVQRRVGPRLCEPWTIVRPWRTQRLTASESGKAFTERMRTFLPRYSVTAAAIIDTVRGVTSTDEFDFESMFAPSSVTGESARVSWLDEAPASCAAPLTPGPDIAWSGRAR